MSERTEDKTASDLLVLIDAELKKTEAEHASFGAKPWTLLVALVSVVGVIIKVAAPGASALFAALFGVAFFGVVELIRQLPVFGVAAGTGPHKTASRYERYGPRHQCWLYCRLFTITRIAASFVVSLLAWRAAPLASVAGLALFGLRFLGLVAGEVFIARYRHVLVPVEGRGDDPEDVKRVRQVALVIRIHLFFGTAVRGAFLAGVLRAAVPRGVLWFQDSYVGVLIAAAVFLLERYTHALRQDPKLEELHRVRRLLLLDRSAAKEVREKLDALLSGEKGSELLAATLLPLIEAVHESRDSILMINQLLDELEMHRARVRNPDSTAEGREHEEAAEAEVGERVLAALDAHKAMVAAKVGPAEKAYNNARNALRFGGMTEEVEAAHARVIEALARVTEQNRAMSARLADMKARDAAAEVVKKERAETLARRARIATAAITPLAANDVTDQNERDEEQGDHRDGGGPFHSRAG